VTTLTTAATNYFEYINFSGVAGPNSLTGVKTSHIVPSYTYNTVNHPITPTGGRSLFASIDLAGGILGGNVNTIRPALDAKYFKQAPWNRKHILAFHGMASMLMGYGGKVAPPFARTYMGGEQDVRGFEIWSISPVAFVPSTASVQIRNADGTARNQKIKDPSTGILVDAPVTMEIPIYQVITPGGDTQMLGNFEYRIPIVGPVILAPFIDAGVNKIALTNQLKIDEGRVTSLNQQYPQAGYNGRVIIAPGTQKPRMSTGIELQVMLPVVNAPFRIYWAYNPLVVREFIQTPVVADRSYFPNYATFAAAVTTFGQAFPYYEKRSMFRFTIGRTF
jgi:outer membrane protein insertion porin family